MSLFGITIIDKYYNTKWIQQLTSADRELIAEDRSKITFFRGRPRISQVYWERGADLLFGHLFPNTPWKQENPPAGNRTRRTARSVTCPGGGVPQSWPGGGRVPPPPKQRTWDQRPGKKPGTLLPSGKDLIPETMGKNLGLGYTPPPPRYGRTNKVKTLPFPHPSECGRWIKEIRMRDGHEFLVPPWIRQSVCPNYSSFLLHFTRSNKVAMLLCFHFADGTWKYYLYLDCHQWIAVNHCNPNKSLSCYLTCN